LDCIVQSLDRGPRLRLRLRTNKMRGARILALLTVFLLAPRFLSAQLRQTQSDDYTRYELLAPGSGKFRILYEVTATTPGATQFFNPIRKGSVASDERVVDAMTGAPLAFDVVS